jgi:exosortase
MNPTQPPLKAPARPANAAPAPRTVSAPRAAAPSPPVAWNDPSQRTPLMVLGGLVFLLVLAYWDMFALTSAAWSEGLYSHGWIVPLGALWLLWLRWEPFGEVPSMERWVGFALVVVGLSARLVAAEYGIAPLDRISFLPAIFGVFMMVGGFHVIRWAGPALGFLVFMFPLPHKLEVLVHLNLQKLASICSTFVLQTLGVSAFRQGNLINMPGLEHPLTIADACSGLRMLTIFCALAVAMVFLIERPWWDKLVILLSSVPIALAVNIIRITVTGLLYKFVGQENAFATKLAHDWAGWLMMPLALGFLWLELQILERLTVPIETVQLRPVGGARGVAVPVR